MSLLPSISTRTISVSTKANQPIVIEHNLGRLVEGWLVVDIDAPARVWRSGENSREKLVLMADQNCSLSIVLL